MTNDEMKNLVFWFNTFFKEFLPPHFVNAHFDADPHGDDKPDPHMIIKIGDHVVFFNSLGFADEHSKANSLKWQITKKETSKKNEKIDPSA